MTGGHTATALKNMGLGNLSADDTDALFAFMEPHGSASKVDRRKMHKTAIFRYCWLQQDMQESNGDRVRGCPFCKPAFSEQIPGHALPRREAPALDVKTTRKTGSKTARKKVGKRQEQNLYEEAGFTAEAPFDSCRNQL